MFDKIIAAVKDVVMNVVIWYAVAAIVGGILYQYTIGSGFNLEGLIQGVVSVVLAGITTALVVGSLDSAS